MAFKPGDLVRLISGGLSMTVTDIKGAAVECTWCEGKKLTSRTFRPEVLALADQAPTAITVSFVKPSESSS